MRWSLLDDDTALVQATARLAQVERILSRSPFSVHVVVRERATAPPPVPGCAADAAAAGGVRIARRPQIVVDDRRSSPAPPTPTAACVCVSTLMIGQRAGSRSHGSARTIWTPPRMHAYGGAGRLVLSPRPSTTSQAHFSRHSAHAAAAAGDVVSTPSKEKDGVVDDPHHQYHFSQFQPHRLGDRRCSEDPPFASTTRIDRLHTGSAATL